MRKHIIVVGGGVIGLSTAYYAAQRRHRVTVLERESGNHEGCSFGNAGMIVPSHFVPLAAPGMVALGLKWMWNPESPFYIKPRWSGELLGWAWKFFRAATPAHVARSGPLLRDLHLASRTCFEDLAKSAGTDFGLTKKGLLMLCKTGAALEEEAEAAVRARHLGIPAEVLDAGQTAAVDPNITMDVAGSVYYPKDCHLSPARFMAALRDLCAEAGVQFSWNTEVTGWQVGNGSVKAVMAGGKARSADEYVVCGGSWSPLVARELGLSLPMQAGKGYSLTLAKPQQLPALCAILVEARIAVTPMGSQLRIGGTMEIAGLNEKINPVRVRGIIKAVPHYYPELNREDFVEVPVWRGLRPCSPDGLPYLGRTKRFDNLSIATGHAMMGLSLGPISGKLMAEVLSDEHPSQDLGLLSPDRYG